LGSGASGNWLRIGAWLSLGLAASLAGCADASRSDKSLVVVASYGSIDTIDPAQATTVSALQLLSALGDPLYAINADGQIEPRLARALPELSGDGLRAVIPLRRDVLFHDGSRFDAEAMAFSLRRFLAIGKLSYVIGDRIQAVRVLAPDRLEISLKRPFSPLTELLTSASLTPVSPTAYRNYKRSFLTDGFVGTGPYRLSFHSPQLQRLEPFRRYWGPPASNQGIALVGMNTSTSLFGALRSGSVDVLLSTSLEPDQQAALHSQAKTGELREGAGPALEIGYISLLSDRPPLNRLRLRQALSHSIDRSLISSRVTDSLRPPLRGLVPPVLPGALSPWPGANFTTARKLLSQEGYCQGKQLALNLTFRSNVPSDRLFALTWQELLRSSLGDCVKLDLTGMESTTAYRQLGDGAFQMILLDWMGDYPDADNYLMPLLGCSKGRANQCLAGSSAASGSFWTAPGLEAELLRTEELRGAERLESLHRVQRTAAAGVPYLPVWQVRPRAWSQRQISAPRFDGSGRLILAKLSRQEQR
jgi:peptide/nickel transport system substrate-binding protein